MMTYLIIPFLQVIILLVSVMATPVKTVKTSDYHFSKDIIDINKPDKEKSKQITNFIKDNEKKIIKLTSIIDNIFELSNNHNNDDKNNKHFLNNKYYENFRSFVIKKNNKYSMISNNLKQEMTSNNNYKKKMYDSKIFYVRLPAAVPYWITSLINLPIDFISNGKPSSIYQWGKPSKRKRSSPIIKLKKGPYEFNGRPTSLFLVGSNSQTSVAASKKKNSSSST